MKIILTLLLVIFSPINLPATEQNQPADNKELIVSFETINKLVDQRNFNPEFFNRAIAQQNIDLTVAALQGLGRIGGDLVVPLVAHSLSDPRASVRRAAVFAIGISGAKETAVNLWTPLKSEANELVKQEIYLALGNLGEPRLVEKLLAHYKKEKHAKTIASIFQSLAKAVTYHPTIAESIDMRKSQTVIDFAETLSLLERDDIVSYHAGYFLARIKNIEKRVSPTQLQKFTVTIKNIENKKILARLIGKISRRNHLANRRLISWLIEQSEQSDIELATESIRAMANLLSRPQAKIQLQKLQASKQPLIAQTALQALADSSLSGKKLIAIFEQQLNNPYPGVVVAAISGLMSRQEQADQNWITKIFDHKSVYVKIRFSQMILEKSNAGFKTLLAKLSNDINPRVSEYAKRLLNPIPSKQTVSKIDLTSAPNFENSSGRQIILKTTAGKIIFQLNKKALYTGANFIRLVQSGYYDKTFFSRVIGNFVAQGGDNIGDGNGESGLSIREEISYLSHSAGSVGIATAGKDSGDSQFFINLSDNIHLDRNYTVFAQVIEGMDIVSQLHNGDMILSAEVL